MAKKAPAKPVEAAKKPPAKRKPRPKKPVDLSEADVVKPVDPQGDSTASNILSAMSSVIPCLIALVIGAGAGVWAAGGIPIGPKPTPGPVYSDTLQAGFAADRASQVAVLRELTTVAYDPATPDGRRIAVKWFNENRFRNRATDYKAFTDAVADAIFNDKVKEFADKLEGK